MAWKNERYNTTNNRYNGLAVGSTEWSNGGYNGILNGKIIGHFDSHEQAQKTIDKTLLNIINKTLKELK